MNRIHMAGSWASKLVVLGTVVLGVAAASLAASFASSGNAAVPPTTTTAPAIIIPADGDHAAEALQKSPRHGEWVDVLLPGPDSVPAPKLHTWVVYPERKDKAPVVLVIHEIFGMTDWVRAVADQLAAEGFIAVAPDLLSGKGPNGGNSDSFKGDAVRDAISQLKTEEVTQRLNAARAWAIGHPAASGKTACIGFCWGGSASFTYATNQKSLQAAVICYGTAPKENAVLGRVSCRVLGLYAGDDARVTSTVEETAKAMEELRKPFEHETYEGAGHGFMRQQTGRDGANLKAAQAGWARAIAFLKNCTE